MYHPREFGGIVPTREFPPQGAKPWPVQFKNFMIFLFERKKQDIAWLETKYHCVEEIAAAAAVRCHLDFTINIEYNQLVSLVKYPQLFTGSTTRLGDPTQSFNCTAVPPGLSDWDRRYVEEW